MKYWKPRAAAIVIIIAAMLTGTLGIVNNQDAVPAEGAAQALNRFIGALTGADLPDLANPATGDAATAELRDALPDGAPDVSPTPTPAEWGPMDWSADPTPTPPANNGLDVSTRPIVAPPDTWVSGNGIEIEIGSDGGGEPEAGDGQAVAPNQRIDKDYHVQNTGTADAYVFMAVSVPYVTIATQKQDGTYVPASPQPLYTFTANPGWTLLEDQLRGEEVTYVYAYARGLGQNSMTALAPGASTGPLFNQLVTANYVEGRLDGTSREVVARAYAIQATALGSANTPAAIWKVVQAGR